MNWYRSKECCFEDGAFPKYYWVKEAGHTFSVVANRHGDGRCRCWTLFIDGMEAAVYPMLKAAKTHAFISISLPKALII
jgi:hypothetical protein